MIRWAVSISLVMAMLPGCATTPAKSPLPDDGPTMREILEREGQPGQPPRSRRALAPGASDLHGYTRDAYNELEARFPRLPNPVFIMYVFPHLSREGTPVPGYSTMFPMYESVEYALPGEVP